MGSSAVFYLLPLPSPQRIIASGIIFTETNILQVLGYNFFATQVISEYVKYFSFQHFRILLVNNVVGPAGTEELLGVGLLDFHAL